VILPKPLSIVLLRNRFPNSYIHHQENNIVSSISSRHMHFRRSTDSSSLFYFEGIWRLYLHKFAKVNPYNDSCYFPFCPYQDFRNARSLRDLLLEYAFFLFYRDKLTFSLFCSEISDLKIFALHAFSSINYRFKTLIAYYES
jgi:hypothetical protein